MTPRRSHGKRTNPSHHRSLTVVWHVGDVRRNGPRRAGRRALLCAGASILLSLGTYAVAGFSPAGASITTAFTTQGCTTFTAPHISGGTVQVTAVGAKGADGSNADGHGGGNGDGVSATLTGVTTGLVLDVCTDVGGGNGGSAQNGGGSGGGASSVALGSNGTALVVAGGGGGEGGFFGGHGGGVGSTGGTATFAGGTGASAGVPGPGAGDGSTGGTFSGGQPGGGGTGGAGAPTMTLTDSGGGGGGGAGYAGGGGGAGGPVDPHTASGGGGGGGGSDYCVNSVISGITVSACSVSAGAGTSVSAGSASGAAQVVLSYTLVPTPSIATTPSPSVAVGNGISDSASLTGGNSPSGTVTFNLYGPNNSGVDCTDNPVATGLSAATVSGGSASSGTYTATAAGTYYWQAVYSGDANNNGVTSACSALNSESVVVQKATPSISTTPSPSVLVGGNISDSANVTGGDSPSGTVTFSLYGPNNSGVDCTDNPVTTGFSAAALSSGSASSGNYATTTAGTYYWQAASSGDANNNSVTSACTSLNSESVVVQKATASISSSTATGPITIDGIGGGLSTVSDSAVLAGGRNVTGSLTFSAYGPSATANCSSVAAFTSSPVAVNGDATYALPSNNLFTPTTAGDYYWVVTYSGDTNNNAITGTGACGATGETSVVNKTSPRISTAVPFVNVPLGTKLTDTATITQAYALTGETVTFALYGPTPTSTPSCSTLVGTVTGTIGTSGMSYVATSGSVVPTARGYYHWVAIYGGDINNNSASGTCGDPNETVQVVGLLPNGNQLTGWTSCAADSVQFSTGLPSTAYAIGSGYPGGLTFNSSTGVLSGTPSAAGSYSFTITASTPGLPTIMKTYAMTVGLCIDGGTATLPGATRGHAYSFQLTGTGGKAPYRFVMQSPGLPAGLSLSLSGLISGTTNAAPGTYSMQIYVSDSANPQNTGLQTLTITVN